MNVREAEKQDWDRTGRSVCIPREKKKGETSAG